MEFHNQILATLPRAELDRLQPALEHVQLTPRMIAYDPLTPIQHVYFVESGVISIVSIMRDRSAIETATIGCEGMIGLPVFLGVDAVPEQAFVQVVPGDAYRMAADRFTALAPQLPALSQYLNRFAVCLFTLAAQCSGCNRVHTMEQRCARWLLMVHDRMRGDDFVLTQDFLSQMLGVRRATVSETMSELQSAGFVSYTRGRITVINRRGLEETSCECYGIIRSTFSRILEGRHEPNVLETMRLSEEGSTTAGDGDGDGMAERTVGARD
jgi:CRP-like cAMP-binding protein